MPKWLVIPKGKEIERLRINTGLEQYTLNDKPVTAKIHGGAGMIRVWVFGLDYIEEHQVKQHMVREKAKEWRCGDVEASIRLRQMLIAIPIAEVDIVEVQDE